MLSPKGDKTVGVIENSTEELLLELVEMRMPFGKYTGRLLLDLPEPYVVWYSQHGFPGGKLGTMLRLVYEIKANGLEYLFEPLRKTSHS